MALTATENTIATYSRNLLVIITFISFMSFLLVYADKDGYEGDDLNSIVPAMHLDEMREGLITSYKYDWQPLSYQLSNALYKATNTPESMFIVSPVSIAVSILILFFLVHRLFGTEPLAFLCLLLMLPEFIYTGLYYNSHAPACLFYILAIWVLLTTELNSNLLSRAVLVGSLASLSILFRFDYVLAFPILPVLFYLKTNTLHYPLIAMISAALVGLSALFMGVFSLSDLFEIYRTSSQEIGEKSLQHGWDRYTKSMALTVTLSPFGWLFFLAGTFFFFIKRQYVGRWHLVLIMLAILPMLYPFKDLLSAKYALPFLTWVFIFGAYLFKLIPESLSSRIHRKFQLLCFFFTVFFLFFSINIDNESPYLSLSLEPARIIGSHDGSRSWGGYLKQFLEVKSTNHRAEGYIEAKKLIQDIRSSKEGIFIIVGKQPVFEESSFGWRYVQLFLAGQDGVRAEVVGKNHVRMYVSSNVVHMCEDLSCLSANVLSQPNVKIIYPNSINL